jgi:FAD/FMN-containing dehydrogenase
MQVAASPREQLAAALGARLSDPAGPGYDEYRRVFNAMIDRRPAVIARCTGAADVVAAVNFARDEGLPVAVRGGGHSVSGNSTCDDGVLIDLSLMKGVRVDPEAKTARAAGGANWGEFDRETQLFGLATPGGRITTTGVGGFTTGGGYGWLSPKYGLTCDNLISADVVTADGRVVVASENENEDLFWGIRGGSSNFGVVTSFEFTLHEVGPIIYAGLLIYKPEKAADVGRFWRDFVEAAPEEFSSGLAFITAPPEPFVPQDMQGKLALGVPVCWCGDVEAGERELAPLKAYGPPDVDLVGPMPYVAFEAMLDPTAPWGMHNYWRGLHLKGLSDGAIDAFVANPPEGLPLTQAIIFRHGGAVSRVPEDATAVSHRDAAYMFHPLALWPDSSQTDQHLAWIFRASEAMEPFTTGGVYLNFTPEADRVRSGFADDTYTRLVALKDKYDPTNMFRFNANIAPAA